MNPNTKRPVQVEAYSGHRANERPVAVTVRGERIVLRRVLERYRTPERDGFRVEAENGEAFWIVWDRVEDRWWMEGPG